MKRWDKQFFVLLVFLMCMGFAVPAWAADKTSGDYTYTVNDDGSSVTISKYKGDGGDVTIPSTLDGYTVTAIGNKAFNYNDDGKKLIRVAIPNSVTIQDGVKSIGKYAFSGLKLTKATIAKSVTSIGFHAIGYYSAEKNGSTAEINNFVLYGYTGSAAQSYAEKNDITFKALDAGTLQTPTLKFKSFSLTKAMGDKDFTNKLTTNTDGTISYESSDTEVAVVSSSGKVTIKGVGTAKITAVAAEGAEYAAASKSYTLTVNPSKVSLSGVKNVKGKKMKVTWKKNTTGTGYQIQYSTSSKFNGAKTVKVKKNKTTSKTISKLKKGKKYYVRIRSYKKVSGKTYYSAWSSKKRVTIKK